MSQDICPHCKKPVLDGEARFTDNPNVEQHYDCWRAAGGRTAFDDLEDRKKKLTALGKDVQDTISKLRDKLRRL